MSSINDVMAAVCNYEHRDAKGRLVSTGKTKIDWRGDIHAIQKNVRTGEVTVSVFHSDGTLVKKKVKIPIYVKLLRLVGLKKRDVKL